jgi:hypothetical protein
MSRTTSAPPVAQASKTVPSAVYDVLRTAGEPLDAAGGETIGARLGFDFSSVRIHRDARAAASARALGADAYTVGQHIVFGQGRYSPGTSGGRDLLTHELTHTVQQRDAGPASGAAALSVSSHESATESEARAAAGGSVPMPRQSAGLHIARQDQDQSPAAVAARDRAAALASIRAAMSRAQPVAGVGDFGEAFRILNGLSVDDQIVILRALNASGELEVLVAHAAEAAQYNGPKLRATMRTVRLLDSNAASVGQSEVDSVAADVEQMTAGERSDLMTALARARVPSTTSAITMEGLTAMMAAASASAPALNPSFAGVNGPVAPGPWQPPGNQPIPFYLGTAAHLAIAAEYRLAHPGDRVETNFTSVETILGYLSQPPFNLTPNTRGMRRTRLDGMPDIANLTQRHIYEIKPQGSEALAATEAAWYVASFVTAGVPMQLGPQGVAGVSGIVPAPGGIYIFECVAPGVIVYQLRRAQLVEVPVPQGEPARRRFEIRTPTAQQMAPVVAVGMAAAILAFLARFVWLAAFA